MIKRRIVDTYIIWGLPSTLTIEIEYTLWKIKWVIPKTKKINKSKHTLTADEIAKEAVQLLNE